MNAHLIAAFLFVQDAQPLQQFTGVLCFNESAAEESALAYQEGGLDLQDEVVDNLINVRNECKRFNKLDALQGYIVYEGAVIGDKVIVGLSPNPDGPAQMFGLMNAGETEPLTKQRDASDPIQQLEVLQREARQLEEELAVIRDIRELGGVF